MGQAKKKSYSVYVPLLTKLPSVFRKLAPSQFPRGMTDKQILSSYIADCRLVPESQSVYMFAEELRFKRDGSQVIFPESELIIDNLLRARYAMDTTEGFTLPYDSFILAMPRGYSYQGVEIPSLMVNVVSMSEYEQRFVNPLLDEYEVPKGFFKVTGATTGELISLIHTEPGSPEKSRVFLSIKEIQTVLQAKNPDDYRETMLQKGFIRSKDDLTDLDSVIQFYAFRLIAALGVYHAATNGEKLRAGFPSGQEPKLEGWRIENKFSPITLTSSAPPLSSSDTGRDSYHRTWFFRQLRADRYYKGEYAGYAPGSRYSFVQETIVGMNATPSTQE